MNGVVHKVRRGSGEGREHVPQAVDFIGARDHWPAPPCAQSPACGGDRVWGAIACLEARLLTALSEGISGLRLELLPNVGIDQSLHGVADGHEKMNDECFCFVDSCNCNI